MRDKEYLVQISNRLTIAGLLVLGFRLTGSVLLISDILFKSPAPAISPPPPPWVFLVLWVALPLAPSPARRPAGLTP